jgi:protein SCO1/2
MKLRAMYWSLILLVLAACSALPPAATPTAVSTPAPDGISGFEPPKPVRDFTLTDQGNAPFALSSLRGKWVLIFFGFTNCPDICPATLARFKQIKGALGAAAEKVAFVFISVDGSRDTVERVGAYVSAFDPSFIGLTGEETLLREIVPDFGVGFRRRETGTGSMDYVIDHTAAAFLLDREGAISRVYAFRTEFEPMLADVRAQLAK